LFWKIAFGYTMAGGEIGWSSDDTIAQPVYRDALKVSVQQVNYHAGHKRYMFANWAWVDWDGNP
jgi:hypothetical protein